MDVRLQPAEKDIILGYMGGCNAITKGCKSEGGRRKSGEGHAKRA